MKRILNKKVNKEAKEQFGNVIERCENHCSIEDLEAEAAKSTIKAEDIKVEEYILLPTGKLVIK